MTTIIRGSARVLGDEVSTDIHCSSKYLPGRDTAYIAQHAFGQLAPGFAQGFPDKLEKLIEYLHKGPFGSHVSAVDVECRVIKKEYTDFSVVY